MVRTRGSILILVLIMIAVVGVLVSGLCYRAAIAVRVCSLAQEKTRAFWLAIGAVERCKLLLAEAGVEAKNLMELNGFERDAFDEQLLGEKFLLKYKMSDEFSRLNINVSNPGGWLAIEGLEETAVVSLNDWIDADDMCSYDGAEDEYYSYLNEPYRTANKPVGLMRETMFVRDVGREGYLKLLEYFTCYGDGRININTADSGVVGLLGGLSSSFSAIVKGHIESRGAIESAGQFSEIVGLSEIEVGLASEYFKFVSDCFRVDVEVSLSGEDVYSVCAILHKQQNRVNVISVERLR